MRISEVAKIFWHIPPMIGSRGLATHQKVSRIAIEEVAQISFHQGHSPSRIPAQCKKNEKKQQIPTVVSTEVDRKQVSEWLQLEKSTSSKTLAEDQENSREAASVMETIEPAVTHAKSNKPDLPVPMSLEEFKEKRLKEKKLLNYEEYVKKMTANVQKYAPEQMTVLCTPSNFEVAYEGYVSAKYNEYLYDLGGAVYCKLL